MKAAYLVSLFTCLTLASSTLFAAEGSQISYKPDLQGGDIYQPQGLWPLLGVGLGVMDTGDQIRSGGVPMHAKILGSYYFATMPWVADAGLGIHSEVLTQDGPGSNNIISLYSELAARYRMTNRWQIGAIWNTLVDNPHRYRSQNDNLASFVGGQLLKEFTYNDRYLVRAGGRAMTSIGLQGETVNTVMGEIEVSFGQSQRVAAQPVEMKPRVMAPHLATHAMHTFQLDPGPVHFETDSTKLVGQSREYLNRLAHALAANHQLFDKVEVIGHADQRGTAPYNLKLSSQRALSISNNLISAGLNKRQIALEAKGETELLTKSFAPAALARNRRVQLEFSGVKNKVALKNILDAVQR